jgi:hydrogenase-4 component F
MLLWVLTGLPLLAGVAAYGVRHDGLRRGLWMTTAIAHLILSVCACVWRPADALRGWLSLDALGVLFLPLTSFLFLVVSIYGLAYVRRESGGAGDANEESLFRHSPEAVFTGCLLLFLGCMVCAILAQHLGLMWVAIEATTLVSAPLVYYHRHKRSLEAAWKYLIICSVGIALALLGVFFVAMSASTSAGPVAELTVADLSRHASLLSSKWLQAAFIFILVGYGTKMGLAPMHNWLPDAHSEAPSPVSALLSGALLNCAFLGILRLQTICAAAGIGGFGRELLILFGLFSMGLAGALILRQGDYKRMLAYSSVEHMGILALGVGVGGAATFGALLHALNHSVVKTMLFLGAGNILARFHSKRVADVSGLRRVMPWTGALWLAGFIAITGAPPFGMFVSELLVLKGLVESGRWTGTILYLAFLSLVFVGMALIVLPMSLGKPRGDALDGPRTRECFMTLAPILVLCAVALTLGLHIPSFLRDALENAAILLGGGQ